MSNDHATDARFSQRLAAGRHYWQSPRGQRQWRAERSGLAEVIARCGGQQALELGFAPTLLSQSPIRHCMRWAEAIDSAEQAATLVCRPDALPLADESLDLTLVHHLLEIAPDPKSLLREAARVTNDSGRLLVIGWHPLGISGPRRLFRRPCGFHHSGEWISVHRMRDWLGFVDFEIERLGYSGYLPFDNTPEWLAMEKWGQRYNLPLGRAWMISARRRGCRMIPLRRRFNPGAILGARQAGLAAVGRWPALDERAAGAARVASVRFSANDEPAP
ncbi:class I SAM-dependent methyltransferase [Kushneria aurantia]|uniref:Class I SAM-dependent methyltransferase n=1 Tax=Kushneria aurantia TaxID=504092 RepID=A0ABV6G3V2_9GAMM|nr:methyltransferase domain-containing protein [Kushneria aurantia]